MQRRIVERIGLLSTNPRPNGAIKLSGSDSYRIRVGDFRVIYAIYDARLLILIIKIGNRRDVYD